MNSDMHVTLFNAKCTAKGEKSSEFSNKEKILKYLACCSFSPQHGAYRNMSHGARSSFALDAFCIALRCGAAPQSNVSHGTATHRIRCERTITTVAFSE